MRGFLIRLCDLIDAKVFGHRWHWYCDWVGSHPWWDCITPVYCPKCGVDNRPGFGGFRCYCE